MKTLTKTLLIAGLIAGVQLGCGDDDTEETRSGDSDSDSDSGEQGGTDSDTDTNQTGDTDSGGETQIPACETCLKADADGNVSSELISGSWFTYADSDSDGGTSTITGSVSANGGYCAAGQAAQVLEGEDGEPAYSTYWGAGIGFNLCQVAGEEGEEATVHNIGTCPTDLSAIKGFRFILTGEFSGSDLRVTFSETDRNESTHIVANPGDAGVAINYLFEEADISYASDGGDPIDVTKVQALQVQVSTNTAAPVDFDFCVENVEPIL